MKKTFFSTTPIINGLQKVSSGSLVRNGYCYKYTISDLGIHDGKHRLRFVCKGAKINKEILREELDSFLKNLPQSIDASTENNKDLFIKFRVSESEKTMIQELAALKNMTVSALILASLRNIQLGNETSDLIQQKCKQPPLP